MADAFNPPNVWVPFGAFSMGMIQGDGQVIHLKGQVALDEKGQVVGMNDMRTQVRRTLENIEAVLSCAGGEMRDIIVLTTHVTDIDAFMATGDIRRDFFTEPFPVTTTVQVVRLYHPDLLVEITATAEIPRARFRRPAGVV